MKSSKQPSITMKTTYIIAGKMHTLITPTKTTAKAISSLTKLGAVIVKVK